MPTYPLFDVFGVELEYMIVDRETLAVRPVADELLRSVAGAYVSDVERGAIGWSNELVNHVVELKTSAPVPSLAGLDASFVESIAEVNERLAAFDAMLLPTGAHPLMDPYTETRLWPHEYNEIYSLYNRIFDCRGHGWSNLQSTHLNLPFQGDDEFGRLHAAIRVLLPILPALSASTPILDGRFTGFLDARLEAYRHNQARIPSIAGRVVPEPVFTEAEYHRRIFTPIIEAIRPYDTEEVLDHHFLNSRGAIARFDRGAIEIRVLDIQECPGADVAILQAVVAVLRALVAERWAPLAEQQAWTTEALASLFEAVVRDGEATRIETPGFAALFGAGDGTATAGALWRHLVDEVRAELPGDSARRLEVILSEGTLATRILRHLGGEVTPPRLRECYRSLARCLAENRMLTRGE